MGDTPSGRPGAWVTVQRHGLHGGGAGGGVAECRRRGAVGVPPCRDRGSDPLQSTEFADLRIAPSDQPTVCVRAAPLHRAVLSPCRLRPEQLEAELSRSIRRLALQERIADAVVAAAPEQTDRVDGSPRERDTVSPCGAAPRGAGPGTVPRGADVEADPTETEGGINRSIG
jgi:hypothetical protein